MNRLTRRPWQCNDRRIIFPITDCWSEPSILAPYNSPFPDVPCLDKPSLTSVVATQIKKWGPHESEWHVWVMYGRWNDSVRANGCMWHSCAVNTGKKTSHSGWTPKQNTQTPSGSRFPGHSFAGERTPVVSAYQPGGISSYSDIIPNDGALKACHLHFQSKKTKNKKKNQRSWVTYREEKGRC